MDENEIEIKTKSNRYWSFSWKWYRMSAFHKLTHPCKNIPNHHEILHSYVWVLGYGMKSMWIFQVDRSSYVIFRYKWFDFNLNVYRCGQCLISRKASRRFQRLFNQLWMPTIRWCSNEITCSIGAKCNGFCISAISIIQKLIYMRFTAQSL